MDQGWAWVILIGKLGAWFTLFAIILNTFFYTLNVHYTLGVLLKEVIIGGFIVMIFGVLYLEFLDYYSATPSATAWIGSVAEAITCVGGT